MSFADVGKVWSRASFPERVKGMPRPQWVKGVTLHHTGAPSLATRPTGFTAQHIENIARWYSDSLKWNSGPHLFTDEDQIWGMTPLEVQGVHARAFNRTHIGIEVLGEYDSEDPKAGRGLQCWITAAHATAAILSEWNLDLSDIKFHREDPNTSKSCPGRKVTKEWFCDLVENAMDARPSDLRKPIALTLGTRMVSVAQFLFSRGSKAKLVRRENGTFLGSWRLETAHYNKEAKVTYATERELEQWFASNSKPQTSSSKP